MTCCHLSPITQHMINMYYIDIYIYHMQFPMYTVACLQQLKHVWPYSPIKQKHLRYLTEPFEPEVLTHNTAFWLFQKPTSTQCCDKGPAVRHTWEEGLGSTRIQNYIYKKHWKHFFLFANVCMVLSYFIKKENIYNHMQRKGTGLPLNWLLPHSAG